MEIQPLTIKALSPSDTVKPVSRFQDVMERVDREFTTSRTLDTLLQGKVNGVYGDLLQAQISMQGYALRVEMLSKAGESLSGTVRRLQQG